MNEDELEPVAVARPGVGDTLRTAREARGLTLEQVAAATRIPQRQLVSLEAGELADMPARTYAIGFAKTYAKLVGLDPNDIAAQVRTQLDASESEARVRPASFEPGDPARVPSRLLGWLSVLAVILVLAGLFVFYRTFFAPAAELPSLVEQQEAEQRAAAAARQQQQQQAPQAAPRATGPVVFTALEDAWVRFYTPQGTLAERVLAKGETYTVPAEAVQPMLRTGRPDALTITVGGRAVPKLSEQMRVMSDVPVTAEALLARGGPTPATTPAARPSPTT